MTPDASAASAARWTERPYHRAWLVDQASGLFDFFEPNSIKSGLYRDLLACLNALLPTRGTITHGRATVGWWDGGP